MIGLATGTPRHTKSGTFSRAAQATKLGWLATWRPSTTARTVQSCSPACAWRGPRSAAASSSSSPPTPSTASPPTRSTRRRAAAARREGPRPAVAAARARPGHPDPRRARRRGARGGARARRERSGRAGSPSSCPPSRPSSWDLGETRGTVAVRMPAQPDRPRTARRDRAARRLERQPHRAARRDDGRRRPHGMLGDSVAVYLDGGAAGADYPTRRPGTGSTIVDATGLATPGRQAPHRARRRHPRRRRSSRSWGPTGAHKSSTCSSPGSPRSSPSGSSLLIWQLSTKYRLYPKIRERDVHTTPTPRLGGIAMFLGIVAAFAVASQHPAGSLVFVRARADLSPSSAPRSSSCWSASPTTSGTSTG